MTVIKDTYLSSTIHLVPFPVLWVYQVLTTGVTLPFTELYNTLQQQYAHKTSQPGFAIEPSSKGGTITLEKELSALEIVRRENVSGHFGVLARISKGSTLEICGTGFNDRTYRVRYQDRLFFVFRQDLGSEPSGSF
jgi:hypothetical protein